MSSFSADWLLLREPADHRARHAALLARLVEWLGPREALPIVDLGCGAGSNALAMIPHLPGTQHWRLLDHNRSVLELARERLASESARHVRAMSVKLEETDLARGVDALLAADCDLVTAAALFDLVSAEWLDGLASALAARRLPLYAVLIYDGSMVWEPVHPADAAILNAFNAHQRTDKGFGPAAGPDAGTYLVARLMEKGYAVQTAPSPWRLDGADHALLTANAEGIAEAVRETGRVAKTELTGWLTLRREPATRGVIGHTDLLAFPQD